MMIEIDTSAVFFYNFYYTSRPLVLDNRVGM
jgi:hypothetical protein